MLRLLYTIFIFCLLSSTLPVLAIDSGITAVATFDDEYDIYRKKGDGLFKTGDYTKARQQYQNCLEVPGFENDTYAKEQIAHCDTRLALRQQAAETERQSKWSQVYDTYKQLLTLNPNDEVTKELLAGFYERRGDVFCGQQRAEGIKYYELALDLTKTRQETLRLKIRDCTVKPSKQIGLKLFTGTVAVGAGAYAYLLRKDFYDKRSTLVQVGQETDPDGNGIIDRLADKQRYDAAYDDVMEAQKKNNLFKACVGVAAVATLAEVYLLVRKPRPRTQAIRWQPSSQSWGLALRYDF